MSDKLLSILMTTMSVAVIIMAVAVFNLWLDLDCPAPLYTGYLTWHGRECLTP